ncbi:MAG: hypothetical protein MJ211_15170 [Bacteroidales bacterium]|nr:hypothetical protein [Bacteroidales bacterium]
MNCIKYIILLVLINISIPTFSQYSKADSIAKDCRTYINNASTKLDIDPNIVEAIIFPELIRYSELQDEIEKSIVNGLYVKYGSNKGDFSIGLFQIKPSFAENIEYQWNFTDTLAQHYNLYFDSSNKTEYARLQRIKRLTNINYQCLYIAIFLKLMFFYYPELKSYTKTNQVKLLSTAYNKGVIFKKTTIQMLENTSNIAQFHTDLVITPFTKFYKYSDLAVEHYNSIIK